MPNAKIFKSVLDVLYYSGASLALRRQFGGIGAIFMLHHVLPAETVASGFAPNAVLEVTPEFLDEVISMVEREGFDLVDLDEAARRIRLGGKPFASFTLDDGYRDNLIHALPVFRRHNCPFTIYVVPAMADGTCEIWWRVLEYAIARNERVTARVADALLELDCSTAAAKWNAWKKLYWPVRSLEQHEQRRWTLAFGERHGIDVLRICRDSVMNWEEVRRIAADPLCTIGAHTVHHFNVKALSPEGARSEMEQSINRITQELGQRPQHFAYPYGDEASAGPRDFAIARELGLKTAVTTRKGMLFPAHGDHLTALPRFSLSGEYQNMRYMKTLMSGLPFALFNGLRNVNVT